MPRPLTAATCVVHLLQLPSRRGSVTAPKAGRAEIEQAVRRCVCPGPQLISSLWATAHKASRTRLSTVGAQRADPALRVSCQIFHVWGSSLFLRSKTTCSHKIGRQPGVVIVHNHLLISRRPSPYENSGGLEPVVFDCQDEAAQQPLGAVRRLTSRHWSDDASQMVNC